MTLNCHLTTGFPLDSPSYPFHVSHDVRVMSLHSFQLPLHVPVIFSVYPLHFPCMSRSFVASQFPTSPVVPIGCLVFISVPFMSRSLPLCFPFISRCFPAMSTSYFLPSFSCTSLHFPCAPQHFPQKKTRFFQRAVFLVASLDFSLSQPKGVPRWWDFTGN